MELYSIQKDSPHVIVNQIHIFCMFHLFKMALYVLLLFCRSPGKILSINIPTFEALAQFGVATITTKNTGEVEASYSLTVSLLNFSLCYGILMDHWFFPLKILLEVCNVSIRSQMLLIACNYVNTKVVTFFLLIG